MKLKWFFIFVCSLCFSTLAADKVSVSENENSFTLDNGIVSARVSKRTGNLTSLTYQHLELLDSGDGPSYAGYWSHDVSRGDRTARVTIDPNGNGGKRAEVSIKGIANATAPWAAAPAAA